MNKVRIFLFSTIYIFLSTIVQAGLDPLNINKKFIEKMEPYNRRIPTNSNNQCPVNYTKQNNVSCAMDVINDPALVSGVGLAKELSNRVDPKIRCRFEETQKYFNRLNECLDGANGELSEKTLEFFKKLSAEVESHALLHAKELAKLKKMKKDEEYTNEKTCYETSKKSMMEGYFSILETLCKSNLGQNDNLKTIHRNRPFLTDLLIHTYRPDKDKNSDLCLDDNITLNSLEGIVTILDRFCLEMKEMCSIPGNEITSLAGSPLGLLKNYLLSKDMGIKDSTIEPIELFKTLKELSKRLETLINDKRYRKLRTQSKKWKLQKRILTRLINGLEYSSSSIVAKEGRKDIEKIFEDFYKGGTSKRWSFNVGVGAMVEKAQGGIKGGYGFEISTGDDTTIEVGRSINVTLFGEVDAEVVKAAGEVGASGARNLVFATMDDFLDYYENKLLPFYYSRRPKTLQYMLEGRKKSKMTRKLQNNQVEMTKDLIALGLMFKGSKVDVDVKEKYFPDINVVGEVGTSINFEAGIKDTDYSVSASGAIGTSKGVAHQTVNILEAIEDDENRIRNIMNHRPAQYSDYLKRRGKEFVYDHPTKGRVTAYELFKDFRKKKNTPEEIENLLEMMERLEKEYESYVSVAQKRGNKRLKKKLVGDSYMATIKHNFEEKRLGKLKRGNPRGRAAYLRNLIISHELLRRHLDYALQDEKTHRGRQLQKTKGQKFDIIKDEATNEDPKKLVKNKGFKNLKILEKETVPKTINHLVLNENKRKEFIAKLDEKVNSARNKFSNVTRDIPLTRRDQLSLNVDVTTELEANWASVSVETDTGYAATIGYENVKLDSNPMNEGQYIDINIEVPAAGVTSMIATVHRLLKKLGQAKKNTYNLDLREMEIKVKEAVKAYRNIQLSDVATTGFGEGPVTKFENDYVAVDFKRAIIAYLRFRRPTSDKKGTKAWPLEYVRLYDNTEFDFAASANVSGPMAVFADLNVGGTINMFEKIGTNSLHYTRQMLYTIADEQEDGSFTLKNDRIKRILNNNSLQYKHMVRQLNGFNFNSVEKPKNNIQAEVATLARKISQRLVSDYNPKNEEEIQKYKDLKNRFESIKNDLVNTQLSDEKRKDALIEFLELDMEIVYSKEANEKWIRKPKKSKRKKN